MMCQKGPIQSPWWNFLLPTGIHHKIGAKRLARSQHPLPECDNRNTNNTQHTHTHSHHTHTHTSHTHTPRTTHTHTHHTHTHTTHTHTHTHTHQQQKYDQHTKGSETFKYSQLLVSDQVALASPFVQEKINLQAHHEKFTILPILRGRGASLKVLTHQSPFPFFRFPISQGQNRTQCLRVGMHTLGLHLHFSVCIFLPLCFPKKQKLNQFRFFGDGLHVATGSSMLSTIFMRSQHEILEWVKEDLVCMLHLCFKFFVRQKNANGALGNGHLVCLHLNEVPHCGRCGRCECVCMCVCVFVCVCVCVSVCGV